MSKQGSRMADIARITAAHYGLTYCEILRPDRHKRITYPRMVAVKIAHDTGRTLNEIGKAFGGADHTTVLHSVRKVAARLRSEDGLHEDMLAIRAALALKPRPFELQACLAVAVLAQSLVEIFYESGRHLPHRPVALTAGMTPPEHTVVRASHSERG